MFAIAAAFTIAAKILIVSAGRPSLEPDSSYIVARPLFMRFRKHSALRIRDPGDSQKGSPHLDSSGELVRTPEEFTTLVDHYKKRHDTFACILTNRDPHSVCHSLKNMHMNLFANSPADVVVFSVRTDEDVANLSKCVQDIPNVYIVNLNRHASRLGWHLPDHVRDKALWSGTWVENYRLMGFWRLTTQFHLARMLRYRQILQIDDDSSFPMPIEENIFHDFHLKGLKIAARKSVPDHPDVTFTLPELTQFFLLTENWTPATLFDHCSPKNMTGLTSKGWDRHILYGNFVIYSVQFVSEPIVQRFIRLAIESGGTVRHRWNEQAVMGMAWQLFVAPDEYHEYSFPYAHKGEPI